MEIVGIFDIVADKDDAVNLYDNASYFDYSNYTFCSMEAAEGLLEGWGDENEGISEAYFYVSDAAQLDSVIEKCKRFPLSTGTTLTSLQMTRYIRISPAPFLTPAP